MLGGMFRLALGAIAAGLFFGWVTGHKHGGTFDLRFLALIIPAAVLVSAAIVHWVTHPNGIKDTWSGGSITVAGPNPNRIQWSDWALWLTHTGFIDRRAAMVRVEKRLLMGLIPMGSVVKSTREFNQVDLREKVHTATRRRRGFIDSYRKEETHLTLTLCLSNSVGEQLDLLDLSTGLHANRGQRFMQELKLEVEAAIAAAPAKVTPAST